MISEIFVGEVSAEFVSHDFLIAKINELIRAQNTAELAATDSQHIKPNMPVFAEVKAGVEKEVHGPLSSTESAIAYAVYRFVARHVGH